MSDGQTKLPKYWQQRIERARWPLLMVLPEKHATVYYVLQDRDALFRAAIDVVKARVEALWIVEPNPADYGFEEDVSDDVFKALPEGAIKEAVTSVRHRNQLRQKRFKEAQEHWQLAIKALAGDGVAALLLLEARSERQYEGLTFEVPIVP